VRQKVQRKIKCPKTFKFFKFFEFSFFFAPGEPLNGSETPCETPLSHKFCDLSRPPGAVPMAASAAAAATSGVTSLAGAAGALSDEFISLQYLVGYQRATDIKNEHQ